MAKKDTTTAAVTSALATIGGGALARAEPVDISEYAIVMMAQANNGDIKTAFEENLGGTALSAFDFTRIKVPAGGQLAWSVVNPETGEEDVSKSFEGIIVSFNDQKAFWRTGLDEQGAVQGPPDCSSTDCVQGRGDPGVPCATCEFNQFGTAKNKTGRGKACKDVRMLFVVQKGDILPQLVPVPPTSLKNVRQYFIRLASRGIPVWRAVTRFKLAKDKNAAGIEYAKIEPELVGIIGDDSLPLVRDFSGTIKGLLGTAPRVQVRASDVGGRDAGNGTGEPAARDGFTAPAGGEATGETYGATGGDDRGTDVM